MSSTIQVNVLADVRRAVSGINDVNKSLGKINGVARSAGNALKAGLAAAGVTVGLNAIKNGINEVVTAGSQLQQNAGATDAIFGKNSDTVKKWADDAVNSFGLSKSEYLGLMNTFGAGMKNTGIKDFTGATSELIGKGSDLAATFGGTTKEAVEALGAVMRGEFDSIEKYGISMKQSDVNALLAARGQDKLTGAARKTAEAQAKLDIINQQTTSSTGAFARESNTLAGIQQRNAAAFENLKASIGTALLPILTRFQNWLFKSLPGMIAFGKELATRLGPSFSQLGAVLSGALPGALDFLKTTFSALAAIIAVVAPVMITIFTTLANHIETLKAVAISLGVLAAGYKLVALQQAIMAAGGFLNYLKATSVATKVAAAATRAWAVVQAVMNVVMSANPIALVIIAIAALVAGIIYAYKHSDKFRAIVDKAWKGIKTVSLAVFNFLKAYFVGMFNFYKTIFTTVFNFLKTVVAKVWSGIKSATQAAWNLIKGYIINPIVNLPTNVRNIFEAMRSAIVAKVNAIKTKIAEIKTRIVDTFNGLKDRLYGIGRDIIQGLINGIQNMIGNVLGVVGDLATNIKNKIKGALGINSPSTIFKGYGVNLGEGLIKGIKSSKRQVNASVADLANGVTSSFDAKLNAKGAFAGATPNGSGTFVNNQVTIQSGVGDPVAIGREVQNVLNAYSRVAGRR